MPIKIYKCEGIHIHIYIYNKKKERNPRHRHDLSDQVLSYWFDTFLSILYKTELLPLALTLVLAWLLLLFKRFSINPCILQIRHHDFVLYERDEIK